MDASVTPYKKITPDSQQYMTFAIILITIVIITLWIRIEVIFRHIGKQVTCIRLECMEQCQTDMEQIQYDVFISYSTKDKYDSHGNIIPGNVISQVEDALTAAGISYWIDKKRLVGGVTYSAEIAKQIKNAKVFLYISSANSNASTWTMNEIATASAYGKTIIPFLTDHTPYNPAIMIYIAGIHYIDYLSNPSRAISDLIRAIKG